MLALLFPGQGAQEVGMGRDVHAASAAARAVFEEADAVLDLPLSKLCFEGPEPELRRTEIQQPAILTVSIALLRALEAQAPLAPAYYLGHSLGEYSALVAAGAVTFADAVALVHARGRFMQEAVPEGQGAMAAVLGAGPELVEQACQAAARESGQVVEPANYNAPQQTVIAGHRAAVEMAGNEARRLGAKRAVPLAVSAPFHCRLMAPAAEKLAGELARVGFRAPRAPVVANVDARPHAGAEGIAERLRRQVTEPVRFTESVRALAEAGVTRTLEIGPGRVLSGLVARIDRGIERIGVSGAGDLEAAAAELRDGGSTPPPAG